MFQHRFRIEDTKQYIGGPHISVHRYLTEFRQQFQVDVEPDLRDQVIHQYEYGAPQQVHGYSSNDNLRQYCSYGNHASCHIDKEKFKQVMLKDSHRGNTLLLDKNLLMFIPHLHLTSQGLVDVDNKWKSNQPVLDSTFRPQIWCDAINDWVDKTTERQVYFPGFFIRLIISIWKMRSTYPPSTLATMMSRIPSV